MELVCQPGLVVQVGLMLPVGQHVVVLEVACCCPCWASQTVEVPQVRPTLHGEDFLNVHA